MSEEPNIALLIGYLEEALPAEEMARIEKTLRQSPEWQRALASIRDSVSSDEHSVATIWRRHRLTCASREKLGAYLSGLLLPDESDYLQFHLETIGCRWCLANLEDIRANVGVACVTAPSDTDSRSRRKKVYESSLEYLPRRKTPGR